MIAQGRTHIYDLYIEMGEVLFVGGIQQLAVLTQYSTLFYSLRNLKLSFLMPVYDPDILKKWRVYLECWHNTNTVRNK